MKITVISSMFSYHYCIKVETNKKKLKTHKHMEANAIVLNSEWLNNEIKKSKNTFR